MVPNVDDMSLENDLSAKIGSMSMDEWSPISWKSLRYKREASKARSIRTRLRM